MNVSGHAYARLGRVSRRNNSEDGRRETADSTSRNAVFHTRLTSGAGIYSALGAGSDQRGALPLGNRRAARRGGTGRTTRIQFCGTGALEPITCRPGPGRVRYCFSRDAAFARTQMPALPRDQRLVSGGACPRCLPGVASSHVNAHLERPVTLSRREFCFHPCSWRLS